MCGKQRALRACAKHKFFRRYLWFRCCGQSFKWTGSDFITAKKRAELLKLAIEIEALFAARFLL
jgi:hypothetical protein